jgi:hypothetical protein
VRATDQTKRKQLADEIQKIALRKVAYVPCKFMGTPSGLKALR